MRGQLVNDGSDSRLLLSILSIDSEEVGGGQEGQRSSCCGLHCCWLCIGYRASVREVWVGLINPLIMGAGLESDQLELRLV